MVGLVLCLLACTGMSAGAQAPVGALAIDERHGKQWGWAVDYDTVEAARAVALRECGAGCSIVLSFARCAVFAADQDAESTAYGWGESYASAEDARERALAECGSRGGPGCLVRAWGCNGPVAEDALGLDRTARRQIQQALRAAGFDPGAADGVFGLRTRGALRDWQSSRGRPAIGYLTAEQARALHGRNEFRTAGLRAPAVPPTVAPAATQPPTAAGHRPHERVEVVFWQSIADSTNPAEFEAYLTQFPTGVFRTLAEARLAGLRASAAAFGGGDAEPPGGARATPGARPTAVPGPVDVRRRPGEVFQDCTECPEMVVMPGGRLALGRYEVTVAEYRAFVAATGGSAGGDSLGLRRSAPGSWRDPGFAQTEQHPVTCVNWDGAQAYAS